MAAIAEGHCVVACHRVSEPSHQLTEAGEGLMLTEHQVMRTGLRARALVVAEHQVSPSVMRGRLPSSVEDLHVDRCEPDRRLTSRALRDEGRSQDCGRSGLA